ncbi:MAG: ribosomal-processing cysteine protease Prp [Clostridiales bacterium]|nr:ribosomal-processing cysteine protease Prp [Clostridiales bacterium]
MIQVVYEKKKARLYCTGHARSGEPGKDLVCAACSMLIYGLADSIAKLSGKAELTLESGRAVIGSQTKNMKRKKRAKVEAVYWGYRNAFRLLADNYPAFVAYLEK